MRKTFSFTLILPILLLLSACSATTTGLDPALPTATGLPATATAPPIPTATATATVTNTPEPPTATVTATATVTSSETPLPTNTATPTLAPPTPSGEDAIYIFYAKATTEADSVKGEKKKHSTANCDTTVVAINTGLSRSGDVEADVATGLRRLFSKVKGFGELANPAYLSNIEVQSVDFNKALGLVDVRLVGTYVRSGDRCDDRRVREQVWTTVRQFKGIKTVYILLNGNLLGDILATGQ